MGEPIKLYGAVIFYDDGPELFRECLTALSQAGLDGLICIDGAYKEFQPLPGKGFLSTDGCTDIAREFKAQVFIPAKPWENQMEKRSQYLRLAGAGNYVLIIDTDEILEAGIIDRKELNCEYARICMQQTFSNGEAPIRLIKVYPDLVYLNHHRLLYRSSMMEAGGGDMHKGLWIHPEECDRFLHYTDGRPVTFVHKPHLRSAVRLRQDGDYMVRRKEGPVPSRRDTSAPPPSRRRMGPAAGVHEETVRVKYHGEMTYSGWLISEVKTGGIVDIPMWRYRELAQTFGEKNWELLVPPASPNPPPVIRSAAAPKVVAIMPTFQRPQITLDSVTVLLKNPEVGKVILMGTDPADFPFPLPDRVQYHMTANEPLGAKWQRALDLARLLEPEYILAVGSDDWLEPGYVAHGLRRLSEGWDVYGRGRWKMVEFNVKKIRVTDCRYRGHRDPLGSGKLISANILDRIDWKLYPENAPRGIDYFSHMQLVEAGARVFSGLDDFPSIFLIKGSWPMINWRMEIRNSPMTEVLRTVEDDTAGMDKLFPGLAQKYI
jgi:hypothetical protein